MKAILQALSDIEKQRHIRILYACESGSRAWGFASPDSDYDVRFIYRHSPEWYLSIRDRDESIDKMLHDGELDLGGWDIRKSLALFHNNNGALFEWLHSPIVYREDSSIMNEWRRLASDVFDVKRIAAHYYGMTKRCVQSLESTITGKKYLYALRAALCSVWALDKHSRPPVAFAELINGSELDDTLQAELTTLLTEKTKNVEAAPMERCAVIDAFIEDKISDVEMRLASVDKREIPISSIDRFFQKALHS